MVGDDYQAHKHILTFKCFFKAHTYVNTTIEHNNTVFL